MSWTERQLQSKGEFPALPNIPSNLLNGSSAQYRFLRNRWHIETWKAGRVKWVGWQLLTLQGSIEEAMGGVERRWQWMGMDVLSYT